MSHERLLIDLERCNEALDVALAAEDWAGAGAANRALEATLSEVLTAAGGCSFEALERLGAGLERLYAAQRRRTLVLMRERDAAAGEIAAAQRGWKGARHYLDTAEP